MLLPYPPSANRLWRRAGTRLVQSAEARQYKSQCYWIAKKAGVKVMTGPVAVALVLHPRRNKDGSASAHRIDIDNAVKATLDGLNGAAWLDDGQVVRLMAEVGEAIEGGGLTVEVCDARV